jgi:hypothetical protein
MPRRLLSLAACAVLLAGCASTTPTSEGMIPAFTARGVRGPVHPQAVAIDVKETRQLPDAAFRQALADAITLSKVFSRVVDKPGAGSYVLSVTVTRLEQPESKLNVHLNPTVRMEAGWTLRRADTRATVWEASVRSQHTAGPSDTLDGKGRLRIATEGAVRENIAAGLERISRLNLQPARVSAAAQPPQEPTPVSFPYSDPRFDAGAPLEEASLDAAAGK